ncbi:low-density lipoprotein receptor-related protein 4-like [Anneissia japonica]|uniref:low-density lipoprotein receptor-related protein 4-like n=1 Tax=Anneissia japonica TaxID=1529436 RepID=UPI001425ABD9|nr:low-density lipoprotein receptor-related protein 4-like [Anneissia japonica]
MAHRLGYLRSFAIIIIGICLCNQIKISSQIGDQCPEGKRGQNGVCKDVNECDEGGRQQCGQLCTNTPGSYYCSCLPGYSLASDQWSCLIEDPPLQFLISYDNHVATTLDTGSNFTQFVESDGPIKSCDYDLDNHRAYWVDSKNNAIYTSFLNGSNTQIICNPRGKLENIAVDWINQRLYWTVSDRGLIERINLDGSKRRILVATLQYSPLDIVVEPLKGNIYWIEWGDESRIQSATLDGSNPKVIVQGSLLRPSSLAIDVVDKRLFWIDNETKIIESVNLDGTSRETIATDLNNALVGLSVFADQILWTEHESSLIQRADKYTGKRVDIRVSNTGITVNPVCLKVMHILQQPFSDPLAGYNCTLNLSCDTDEAGESTNNPFIIFSNARSIHRIDFYGRDYQTIVSDNVENVLSLDYNPRDDAIYFADASLKRIERVNLDGTERTIVVDTDIDSIEGLAVDWIHGKLCWTDSGKVWVACSSLSGTNMKVIAGNQIDKPRGIAIHPALNLVYWTDWGSSPKIEAAQLFDSKRVTIVGDTIVWPFSLTIDFQRKKLVWVDSGRQSVEMANLDGTERSIITKSGVHRPWSVAQFGNYVWFTEEERGEIIRLDIDTGRNPLTLSGIGDYPKGIQIVHPSKQDIFDVDPCLVFNGGCEHNCFRAAHNQAACSCDPGYRLTSNMMSCALDECLTNMDTCDPNATCTDTEESYTCTCPEGYSGDGEICINLNPCSMANGGCDQICIFHVEFSDYECRCHDGYKLMNDRKSCVPDRNPCSILNGGCDQICIHANLNQVFCSCDTGFDLKEDGKTCVMDECLLGYDNCDPAAICVNTEDSFECHCLEGYEGDGVTCAERGAFVLDYTDPQQEPTPSLPNSPKATTMQGTKRKTSRAMKFNTIPTLVISTTPARNPDKGHIGVKPTAVAWPPKPTGGHMDFNPNERFFECPVNFEYYCLHGGDCFYSKESNRAKCLCASGYMGARCELLDPTWETPSSETGSSWNLLIIIASVVGLFLLLLVILLMFLYCYRLRKHKKIPQPEDVPLQMRQGSLPMQPNPCNPNTYAAGIATETADSESRKARTLGDYRRLGTFGRRHNDDDYAHIEEDSNHYMIPRPTSNASYSSISTLSAGSSKMNQYAETVTPPSPPANQYTDADGHYALPPPPPVNQYTESDGLYAASTFMSSTKRRDYVPMGTSANGSPRKAHTLGRRELASYMSMDDRPLSQHEYWVTINRNGKLDHVYYNSRDKKEGLQ